MLEQFAGMTCIFSSNETRFAQNPHSAWGHIFKISNGSSDKVKDTHALILSSCPGYYNLKYPINKEEHKMTFFDYSKHDGLGLAEVVWKKKVSPAELVEESISRIETHNPKINAVVQKLYERARTAAKGKLPDGPFKGVPFLMKDLMASVEGVPTSNGNKLWKNIPAKVSTEMAKRWENSGAVLVGKTNTPEFGLTPYTESDTLGAALNPWDTTRTTGGSSGGSGAAVAARVVSFASGGDGGGSMRLPGPSPGFFWVKRTP